VISKKYTTSIMIDGSIETGLMAIAKTKNPAILRLEVREKSFSLE
jgi:hypothetical protein